ncbi:cupin domain-containing protein [Catellatospora sp. KI3]|uniref:cupin domain-containing protein n=1 Tax=Catellatospora sp. KI3 TaxID=3041620 RepID=UPI0024823C0B|nr:cupin domain-containing protein [Catellatospora sp. KI3]MDI1461110.1 cupin domain-containing protein [Catellatospora sp. KI3]
MNTSTGPGSPAGLAPLPGGVGVSQLRVYGTTAPDGLVGGTPHLHLCCTEAYVVQAGTGAVQTLTMSGFEQTPLRPGTVLWFTPGTIHRLVNHGGLEITVLMQNSGLPEAGDAVLTFPPSVLADPQRYAAAAALPGGGAPDDAPPADGTPGATLAAAYARRDLAVLGFEQLRAAADAGDLGPLRDFHQAAARLVAPHLPRWRERFAAGALRAAQDTAAQLDALADGRPDHLADAAVHGFAAPGEQGRHGMCGLLNTYPIR